MAHSRTRRPAAASRKRAAGSEVHADRHVRAFTAAVEQTIRTRRLCQPGQSILVAVSGGPDSVALLRVLAVLAPAWRLSLSVAHVNYGLRGRASQQDEVFVRRLCKTLSVPCFVRRVTETERVGAGSVQAWARDLRYAWFRRVATKHGLDCIAVAHTANDQAETQLLWMLRGAGLRGLAGMPARRRDGIIRPLLDVTRDDVTRYLAALGQAARHDASNDTSAYRRNRVRREIIPALTQLNPDIIRTLARQADLLAVDERWLRAQTVHTLQRVTVDSGSDECRLDRQALRSLPVALQRRVVRAALSSMRADGRAPSANLVLRVVSHLLPGPSGRTIVHRSGIVRVEYDQLVFAPKADKDAATAVATTSDMRATVDVPTSATHPVTIQWPRTGQCVTLELSDEAAPATTSGPRPHELVLLDADRLTSPLTLRTWERGDWFCPAGMGGRRKKLQDFWTDGKVPRRARTTAPLLVSPDGIVWIVGARADARFIATAATKRVIVATVTTQQVSQ
ncbi:MAG: tRNA lysidine(34) synthetase TilS [Nitrospiraceae bacterium]